MKVGKFSTVLSVLPLRNTRLQLVHWADMESRVCPAARRPVVFCPAYPPLPSRHDSQANKVRGARRQQHLTRGCDTKILVDPDLVEASTSRIYWVGPKIGFCNIIEYDT